MIAQPGPTAAVQQIRFLSSQLGRVDGTFRQPAPTAQETFCHLPKNPLYDEIGLLYRPQSLRANRTPTADIGSPTSDTGLGEPQMVAVHMTMLVPKPVRQRRRATGNPMVSGMDNLCNHNGRSHYRQNRSRILRSRESNHSKMCCIIGKSLWRRHRRRQKLHDPADQDSDAGYNSAGSKFVNSTLAQVQNPRNREIIQGGFEVGRGIYAQQDSGRGSRGRGGRGGPRRGR
ncbi:hypothetical protein B0T24DRAFT_214916 [Lasiosphaeria ovina]|uniref:Uncharacterized protein n=1 Tax=Lasiosphaeria ovina TaxID=92902 RepID=A0AAE0KFW7_9PEZI|nr:hypothetical protein B0T24DRAFT_214916 [Lasiosphaeria ovina]